MQVERHAFYTPKKIVRDVEDKVREAGAAGERIDYLTFVPDGEPTLDIDLGREIEMLGHLGLKIGVITNGSLLWCKDVREALLKADWVSLKVDAIQERTWREVDRPHRKLQQAAILEGALEFARGYGGELVTETMLVEGVNDSIGQVRAVADFIARLKPTTAYLAVPTRPPAETWVRSPKEAAINRAYQIFSQGVDRVECLIGYEGNAFAFTGNVEEDLLSITAVHPMREDAVRALLARARTDWHVVDRLLARAQLVELEYQAQRFYIRRLDQGSGK
jgi:wyosine [tRNA(Phe)-imidazoG37] synthetase (radical SAM superfamily)